jgi:hypothetical protein
MGTATRLTNTGTLFINGKLDEVTGMNVSNNLLLNLDASKVANIANNTTIWTDVGPNQYNFSFPNGITYSPTNSGYYNFPGTNLYALAANNFADSLGEMTVAAWIKTSTTTLNSTIVSKCYNLGTSAGWALMLLDTNGSVAGIRLSFFTQQSGGANFNQSYATSTTTVDGTWHYIAATLTGGIAGTIKLYQDGTPLNITLQPGSAGTVTNDSSPYNVTVGSDAGVVYPFNGDIADVQIYNRALSAAEILNNYNAKASLFGLTPTRPAPLMRTSTNTLYVNILDEASLNVGSMFVTQGAIVAQGYVQTSSSTLPWTSLSGTFTVEFWINWTTLGNVITNYIGSPGTVNSFTITFDGTSIAPRLGGGAIGSLGTLINSYNPAFIPNTGQWYHIAVVRNSSNLIMMYVNGVAQGAGTTYSSTFAIGQWIVGNSKAAGTAGTYYMSGIRVSSAAIYTSAFTPPIDAPGFLPSTVFLMLTANSTSYLFNSVSGELMRPVGVQIAAGFLYAWPAPTFSSTSPFNLGKTNIVQRLSSNGTLLVKNLIQTSL